MTKPSGARSWLPLNSGSPATRSSSALAETQWLHAEPGDDEQEIIWDQRRHRATDDAIEVRVVLLENASMAQSLLVGDIAERARQRIAQIVVADSVDARDSERL